MYRELHLLPQGVDWTSDTLWAHVDTIIQCFKAKGLTPPIVYIHNHVPWTGRPSYGFCCLKKNNGFLEWSKNAGV